MKKFTIVISVLIFSIFSCNPEGSFHNQDEILYTINLNQDSVSSSFIVKVEPPGLTDKNDIFNFVSTVPGLYDRLDYGRLVTSFQAFDFDGQEIPVTHIEVNRWQIEGVERLKYIQYEIDESFGSDLIDPISYLGGTDIDSNYAFINTFGVLGYFEYLEQLPVRLELNYPRHWISGTSLKKDEEGNYYANSFEQLADSPILIGELNNDSVQVGKIQVEVFTYSQNKLISAEEIVSEIKPALSAASQLLSYAPVNNYAFLMLFLDADYRKKNKIHGIGALEHRNSSAYVLAENKRILSILNEWAAHEFFHISIPLNLHSDHIRPFNFKKANPDKHLWLYEGVTVWASEIMFLRAGQISLDSYLEIILNKIETVKHFTIDKSLVQISTNIYTDENKDRFDFIDNKGSLAVFCLDLLILDLSGGKFGFRKVLIELMKEYGSQKSFVNENLFSIIEEKTFPEVGNFLRKFILGNEELPVNNYLNRFGLNYASGERGDRIELISNENEEQKSLRNIWMQNLPLNND